MTLATRSAVLPTYVRADVEFVDGDGSWLTAAASYLASDPTYDYVKINAEYTT